MTLFIKKERDGVFIVVTPGHKSLVLEVLKEGRREGVK